MSKAKIVVDGSGRFYGIRFTCPGCALAGGDFGHYSGYNCLPVDWTPEGYERSPDAADLPHWTFNGDLERPTFSPSILTEQQNKAGAHRCHSFVRDGRIEFLSDCTHALRGQTIDLPDLDISPDTT